MKKFNSRNGLIIIAICFSMACNTLKVTSDYDKSTNFSQYKTFTIDRVTEKDQSISQLNRDRIINAVRAEMTKKGFTESDNGDLLIHIVTVLQDKKSVSANTNYYGYGGAYRPYGWAGGGGSSYTTYNVDTYKDGSLIIDIIDAKTKQLEWEGIGNKEIDKPIDDPDTKIPAAVEMIMKSFPPGMTAKK